MFPFRSRLVEVRKNATESGLYFFLLDLNNASKSHNKTNRDPYLTLIDDLQLKFVHSKPFHTGRKAVYLQYAETDFLVNLFDNSVSKECHLSVDRDYLEFEGDENAQQQKKLRWHYCHYTEVYKFPAPTGDKIVHIYFDSKGNITEQKITENGTSRDFTPQELSKINFNVQHATEIVSKLISCKMERSKEASDLAKESARIIAKAGSNDLNEMLKVKIVDYKNYYDLAQRFADTHVIMTSPADIERLIQELIARDEDVEQEQTEKLGTAVSAASTNTTSAVILDAELRKLIVGLDELIKNAISNEDKLDSITHFIMLNMNSFSTEFRKEAQKCLKQIANINYQQQFKSNFNVKKITLGQIEANIEFIETWADETFYKDLIRTAINSKEKTTDLIAVCNFLYKNSPRYAAIIRAANEYTYDENDSPINPQVYEWSIACYENNNQKIFRMLLEHGMDLNAKIASKDNEDSIINDLDMSLIAKLQIDFFLVYNKKRTSKDLERLNQFFEIMFQPQFALNIGGETSAKSRIMRSALRTKIQKKIRSLNQKRVLGKADKPQAEVKTADMIGMNSLLDIAINFCMPDSTVNIILNAINPKNEILSHLAAGFGFYFHDYGFVITLEPTSLDETDVTTQFEPISTNVMHNGGFFWSDESNPPSIEVDLSEIEALPKVAVLSKETLEAKNVQGMTIDDQLAVLSLFRSSEIELRLFIMRAKEDVDADSIRRSTFKHKMLCKFAKDLKIKIDSLSYKEVIDSVREIYNLVIYNIDKSEDAHLKTGNKIGACLGALAILANLKPQANKLLEYYEVMYEAFATLISTTNDAEMKNLYKSMAATLRRKVSTLPNSFDIIAVFNDIDKELKPVRPRARP